MGEEVVSILKEKNINKKHKYGWSKEERDVIMAEMKSHLGERKPEVGSFFYDLKNKKLMLVNTIPTELARDSGNGIKTTDKSHKKVWLENDMEGSYIDIPRGRVFYNSKINEYKIAVGEWLKDAPNIKELVIKRFHLENQNLVVIVEKTDPDLKEEIELS